MTTTRARPGLATRVVARCYEDGEFRIAARFWDGGVSLALPGAPVALALVGGEPSLGAENGGPASLEFTAPDDVWAKLLSPVPPPMFNDLSPAATAGLRFTGDFETYWQYYPALRRLIDLVREEWNADGTV
ncbi:MAG: hypothetical protein ACRDG3_00090 [Tepidiformaceae bacterium]